MWIKNHNFYTLGECVKFVKGSDYDYFADGNLGTFIDTLHTKFSDINAVNLKTKVEYTNTHILAMWDTLLTRYKDEFAVVSDNFLNNDVVKSFFVRLFNKIISTKDKYIEMLSYYSASKTHLMKEIESSSETTSRFNDTPQDGGDYSDDTHTTNITQSSSIGKSERDTPIERLDSIAKLYEDQMDRWIAEIGRVFIIEGR